MDWTSLTTFDPAVLSLLDDSVPQTTATNSALDMDFGFGDHPNKSPFTTIAANPMLMSFADFDSSPDLSAGDTNSINSFNFDMWGHSPQPDTTNVLNTLTAPGLDELFGGNYLNTQSPIDFNTLITANSPSASPVSHLSPSTGTSGSSSSSKSEGQSPISSVGSAEPEQVHGERCPKSREEAAKMIEAAGQSPFVTEPVRNPRDPILEKIVPCKGSGGLPRTEPRPDNVEVLTAWRDVTSLPNFKVTSSYSPKTL
jgi:AP-1-like factor